MSRAVFLMHPGNEHLPKRGADGHFRWNVDRHLRKFLVGRARIARDLAGTSASSDQLSSVGFWGEWEACSIARRFDGRLEEPTAWHEPLVRCPAPMDGQNTDPWVFGSPMYYSNCNQYRGRVLKELGDRDVVFFGSLRKLNPDGSPADRFNFRLDTVFVVGGSEPYVPDDASSWPSDVHPLFRENVLQRLASQTREYSLYRAAMLTDVTPGRPFSWVPCRSFEGDPVAGRFPRPLIAQLFDTDLGNYGQLAHHVLPVSGEDAWSTVTEYCLSEGLELATQIELPTKAEDCPWA